MFRQIEKFAFATDICRQMCRSIVTRTVVNLAGAPATRITLVNDRWVGPRDLPGLLIDNHLLHAHFRQTNVLRHFASKATSKFSRKIKKETYDRYMGLDPSQLQHGFDEVPELQDADENVRRIFSLEFAPGSEIKKLQEVKILEEVGADLAGIDFTNFLVTQIAKWTVSIRKLAQHMERFPRDKSNKQKLLILIARRRKFIKILRRRNFDLANRLLDKLGLEYTPPPRYIRRVTRRSLEKKTVVEQAFQERQAALREFKDRVKEEQLQEIAALKKELGMDLTEAEMGRLRQDGT
ncbi:28S ribosomal protein S15, mitochondrial-like [Acanthaster planci]|uniref:Small ribosomal subunit protein uS15m n=1 Tax=Acanthaster planci TaxID=133434 RepID=A0A8B7YZP8_ACAPL|nr:28S ribosomal protein S15, mitochondrial-like [Acanthaster planci]